SAQLVSYQSTIGLREVSQPAFGLAFGTSSFALRRHARQFGGILGCFASTPPSRVTLHGTRSSIEARMTRRVMSSASEYSTEFLQVELGLARLRSNCVRWRRPCVQ